MGRCYKWQPHEGARHAIPRELTINDVGQTLCDIEVTARSDEWPDEARCWPTCPECDLAWREHEQILPWPRGAKAPRTNQQADPPAPAVNAGMAQRA
ncbi:zinc finger protein [Lentzea sp. E54]|uniref:zinc finger protein n=1 Tax=Lentzea xerophila TaxID=3435883 RepID=UPI003DA2BCAD